MRKILIVIDMQNDFIDGALGTKEAQAIVDNAVDVIKHFDPNDIIATRDTHDENYLNTSEGHYLPVIHCVKNTKGWELNDKIKNAIANAKVIDKPTFGSTELALTIKELSKDEELDITMIGLCTDICVVTNALLIKTLAPDAKLNIIESACAGVTPKKHNAAIEVMRSCQVNII